MPSLLSGFRTHLKAIASIFHGHRCRRESKSALAAMAATARMAGATSERDAGLALLYLCSPMSDRLTAPGAAMIASDNPGATYRREAGARSAEGARFFSISRDYRTAIPLLPAVSL